MTKIKRWVLPALCLTLAIGWAWTATLNDGLREQVSLLKRVAEVQGRWCAGLGEVNTVCEETMVDLAARLGLDSEFMPLVTTALWRRTMPRVTVNKARHLLVSPQSPVKLLDTVDDPKAAIGGVDDELRSKRAPKRR
jgi:hypothetical protein